MDIRWSIGIDISTQTITAMLVGVAEEARRPSELVISSAWTASRPCASEIERKSPVVWLRLVRDAVDELKRKARETELVEAVGVSTTLPAAFTILRDGAVDPALVSLYDNTDDAGLSDEALGTVLGEAESVTFGRMWPGNMVLGIAHLVRSAGLRLEDAAAIVPSNTALANELLRSCGEQPDPGALFSDLTETIISGLYDARTGAVVPPKVKAMLEAGVPEADWARLKDLLPRPEPAWRNVLTSSSLPAGRKLLGLPRLRAFSIGAGDSPLGTLALLTDRDTIINVRGSSDSPMIAVDAPLERTTARETVLHYPLPSSATLGDSPWCAVAPMLRSGKVWDWVRRLRFPDGGAEADVELERLALEALKRRRQAPEGSLERIPLAFNPALGGERAPDWDSHATGSISGLIESHGIGEIALAALEGMSAVLKKCIDSMEVRYGVSPPKLLVVGGPARNKLWNWVTQEFTGKRTYATTFSDASLLGAALLGRAAMDDGALPDREISNLLLALSRLATDHPLIRPEPVTAPDGVV